MQNNSRQILGQQEAIHPNLAEQLAKHFDVAFQRPLQDYNRQAFTEMKQQWDGDSPLILDTGCGTGDSSRQLAHQFPEHFVVGIDQSIARLSKQRQQQDPDNLLLLRADLVDFWRICFLEDVKPDKHYLLYPNPWPKKKHFQRRWCGHPILPFILAVGGTMEFRTNWQVYANEMAFAFTTAGYSADVELLNTERPLTPFERKYQQSAHKLFRVRTQVTNFNCPALDAWLAENRCYSHK